FPRLSAVRTLTPQRVASGRLLGPFRTAAAARDAKALLEAVMPLKTCSQSPRAAAATPCAAAQVGRCHGPCAGQTDAEAYAESLGALRDLYTGVMEGFLDAARQRIGELAAQERYEAAGAARDAVTAILRSEEHTSELQSRFDLVCRLLLEKKNRVSQAKAW